MESFHFTLYGHIKVAHPNLFALLGHPQRRLTTDSQEDMAIDLMVVCQL